MIDYLQKQERKDVLEHKAKFIRVGLPGSASASNLNPHNLLDVLKEPRIAELLADTKAAHEVKLLDQFHACNTNDPDRCTFGLKHVMKAADSCAIKHLLLSDSLFRSTDVKERQMYGQLIGDVKENGGKVMIFAPDTKPAEDLDRLSGVAALLNFPVDFDEY
jgi:protein pelota